jgi:hypothetical protein
MKHFLFSLLMISFMASFAHAAETETDCPWMRESTQRNNPKANLSKEKTKPRNVRGASAQ